MNITKLVLGACSTNVYIVSSNKKNAILIDPADNAAEIIKTILMYLLLYLKLMPDDLKTKNLLMKDLMLKYLIKL